METEMNLSSTGQDLGDVKAPAYSTDLKMVA